MQVNEVRVGNLVQDAIGRIWKIQSIEQIYFTVVELNSTSKDRGTVIDFHNVHPIKLTEDWIQKLGGDFPLTTLQYVHQYQNLYFVIMNRELTMNNN